MNRPLIVMASALAAATLTITACSPPGQDKSKSGTTAASTTVTAPVSVDDVARLGQTTLRIVNDAGDKDTLDKLVPLFEKKYPNVKVQIDTRSYDDLVKTEVNTMAGSTPPDLIQGAQGYSVDGSLGRPDSSDPWTTSPRRTAGTSATAMPPSTNCAGPTTESDSGPGSSTG